MKGGLLSFLRLSEKVKGQLYNRIVFSERTGKINLLVERGVERTKKLGKV